MEEGEGATSKFFSRRSERRDDGLKALGTALSVLIMVALLFAGVGKIVGASMAGQEFAKWGLSDYILIIGFVEIVLAILFIVPETWVIAGFLLSGFFGGAIAIHLSHNETNLAFIPFIMLIVMCVSMFLRKPGVFVE